MKTLLWIALGAAVLYVLSPLMFGVALGVILVRLYNGRGRHAHRQRR